MSDAAAASPRALRIAVVDPAAYVIHYDIELCAALADAGHDVTLYTTEFAHGEVAPARGYRRVEWFYRRRLPGIPRRVSRGVQHPLDMRRLAGHLLRDRPDVVHVQWSVIDRVDVPVWRRLARHLPVVFTAHNSVGRPGDSLGCEQLSAFDAVVAHSEFGARGLRETCPGLEVWHAGIGTYDTLAEAVEPERPPFELGPGPVVALTGLLRQYKGIDLLLEAWPRVRLLVADAQLVVAGRPVDVELPDPAPEGAHLLPRFLTDEEYAWTLQRADVVCLPYRRIDMSGVLFTALALGRPLVLTDVGGFGEFRDNGAELVPPDDAAALADTLATLLSSPERLAELSRQGREAARTRYSWSAVARTYGERYAALVANRAAAQQPRVS